MIVAFRLLDDDKCVAHFSLEQVWEGAAGGGGDYLLKNKSTALHSYLPIGSRVNVLVRGIPHQQQSSLQYQGRKSWI